MPFSGKVGDTYWHNDSSDFNHRWVILTNENNHGEVAVINFTGAKHLLKPPRLFSKKRYKNQFDKDTSIRIDKASVISKQKIFKALGNGSYREGKFCRLDIVNEIVIAMFESDDTKIKVGRELKENYEKQYEQYYKGNDY